MKVPLQWLGEWADSGVSADVLGQRLTMAGFELESIAKAAPAFSGVVVARILSTAAHPNADKLQVCTVDAGPSFGGGAPLQIVCGARNARPGLMSALATVGAELPGGNKPIAAATLRGVASAGMLCSARELGLAEDGEGILELPEELQPGADLRAALALDEATLELNVTPNRGDAMSILGIAREVAAVYNVPLRGRSIEPVPATLTERIAVRLEAAPACPRFAGRVLRGLDPSARAPLWMRERLRRCGVRSINAVVDVTNYVLLELGQPMHAYDLARLEGGLTARFAREGERCMLLDGREVAAEADVLVIADEQGAVGLAGIMGGKRTAVSEATTDVLLEAAHFAPMAIAGRSRRFGLVTDASQRFERGVDYEAPLRAIERASALILQIAGGRAGPAFVEDAPQHLPQRQVVSLELASLERMLGVVIPESRVRGALAALGMPAQAGPAQAPALRVPVPSHRFDLAIEADLVEEVARIVGYDTIPEVDARVPQRLRTRPASQTSLPRWFDTLVARGYHEAITYAFVDSRLQRELFPDASSVALANPIASDLDAMRVSLWPGLLRVLGENRRRQQTRVRLFEHGGVFQSAGTGAAPRETDRLAMLAWGHRLPEQWGEKLESVGFHDLRADVDALLTTLDSGGEGRALRYEADVLSALHPARAARIVLDGQSIGWIGELHPRHVRMLELGSAPLLAELETSFIAHANRTTMQEISRFPHVRRDLAVVVDEGVPFGTIRERVTFTAAGRLHELRLFDIYRGAGVEPGRKSLALGLIFQEKSRTLTDEETDVLMAEIRGDLKTHLGARFRE